MNLVFIGLLANRTVGATALDDPLHDVVDLVARRQGLPRLASRDDGVAFTLEVCTGWRTVAEDIAAIIARGKRRRGARRR